MRILETLLGISVRICSLPNAFFLILVWLIHSGLVLLPYGRLLLFSSVSLTLGLIIFHLYRVLLHALRRLF